MDEKRAQRIQTILLVVVMAIIVGLIVWAAVSLGGSINLPGSGIASALEKTEAFPDFDKDLVDLVEYCFEVYYYTDLPDREQLVSATVAAYDEFCRGKIDESDYDEVTHAVVDCYIYAIGDKYAFYRTDAETEDFYGDMSGSFVGIGVAVLTDQLQNTVLIDSVEPGSPAEAAGILPGDYVVGVDGTRIEDVGALGIIELVRGEVGTSVTVTVKRADKEITVTAVRAAITETTVALSYYAEGSVAYLRMTGFKANSAAQFVDAMQQIEASEAKAIIFDLRGNPGGALDTAVDILSYLVPDGTPIASFSSYMSPIFATSGEDAEYEPTDHVLSLPAAVLVNGSSASAAELFSQALKDYTEMGLLEATVIGEQTYKKGVMQATIPFTNGGTLTLTTALYNPPSGVNFNDVGVTPDIPLAEGEDAIEKALEVLLTKTN